ncbi:MAG: hypothetical protein KGL16_05540 [Acidobacteriota bacterium]|nr:hypothetical protein [Acidobacteriota bacterium]
MAHHRNPTGTVLLVLLVLAVLYVAWRTGQLRRLRGLTGAARRRGELSDLRIRPLTFLPLALLAIVAALLLILH